MPVRRRGCRDRWSLMFQESGGRHSGRQEETYGNLISTSGDACLVLFENATSVPLRVRWLSFKGTKVDYSRILPTQTYCVRTYTTHPWALEDDDGVVYAIYVGSSATVTIKGRDEFHVKAGPPSSDRASSSDRIRRELSAMLRKSREVLGASPKDGEAAGTSVAGVASESSGTAVKAADLPKASVNDAGEKGAGHRKRQCGWLGLLRRSASTSSDASEELNSAVAALSIAQRSSCACKNAGHRGSQCAICLDPLETDVWALKCGHLLHGDCLEQACQKDLECPVCRSRISAVDDVRKVFLS